MKVAQRYCFAALPSTGGEGESRYPCGDPLCMHSETSTPATFF
jgi:hypothetical protein